jgi:hypothetical protein
MFYIQEISAKNYRRMVFFTGKKQQSRSRQQTAIGGVIVMVDCLAANTLKFYLASSVSSLPLLN